MTSENTEEETKQDSGINPLFQKYEEYLDVVKTNPEDFQTWTYLLGTAERLDEMEKITEAFDQFLMEYPLCYGYWKKYADAAERHCGLHTAMDIYERGLQSISYSVDLWSHYLSFQMNKICQTPDVIRGSFERALAYIGHDYLSHLLWDKYFQYESDQKEFRNLAALYKRVISLPIKELETYYGKFVDFAADHEISEVLDEAEVEIYLQQMIEAKQQNQKKEDESMMDASTVDADVHMEEKSIEGSTATPTQKIDSTLRSMDSFTDSEIKEYWIQCMAELYEKTGKELTVRRQYEDCIKRPYFHVKPLDGIQLQTWWKYLDYVISQGAESESMILFERCLVPCALYPEFWIRYIVFLEKFSMEQAQYALGRALQVFCKKKSEMHLFSASFYERHEDLENAKLCLQLVTQTLAPSLLAGIIQQASFECRHQNVDEACKLYEQKIKAELESEDLTIVGYLAVQYAYVLLRHLKSESKAREVLEDMLEKRPQMIVVWEGSIQIEELIGDEMTKERIEALYKQSIGEKGEMLCEDDRYLLSQRFLVFLDLFGTPEQFAEAQSFHIEKFGFRKIASNSQKRASPFQMDTSISKQSYLENSTTLTSSYVANPDSMTSQTVPPTSSASGTFSQNAATAQQYAQYYSQFAAAAAAGYSNYTGYGSSYTG